MSGEIPEAARQVAVIGQHGRPEAAPENTFASFDRALEVGVKAIETDLHRTADGEIVLIHDARVDRTANGAGAVADMTLAKLKKLDVGSWFHQQFHHERIPTLREFLVRYANRCDCVLEIKADGLENAASALVREYGIERRTTFTAFEWPRLECLKVLAPAIHCGWLVSEFTRANIEQAAESGFEKICPAAVCLTRSLVTRAHEAGLSVWTWRVKDESAMRGVVEMGVDGILVNFPDKALDYLASRGK